MQFGRLRAAHELSDAELLRALQPEHLAPCYGFVQIDSYDETPALPRIRYWRQAEGGDWEIAGSCGRQPELQPGHAADGAFAMPSREALERKRPVSS